MQNAKRKVQNVGTALRLYMICHSEECNDEESLLVLLFDLVETLHFVQGDNAGVEACHYAVASLRMTNQIGYPDKL